MGRGNFEGVSKGLPIAKLTWYRCDEVVRGGCLTPVDGASVDAGMYGVPVDEYFTCVTSSCHDNNALKLVT